MRSAWRRAGATPGRATISPFTRWSSAMGGGLSASRRAGSVDYSNGDAIGRGAISSSAVWDLLVVSIAVCSKWSTGKNEKEGIVNNEMGVYRHRWQRGYPVEIRWFG